MRRAGGAPSLAPRAASVGLGEAMTPESKIAKKIKDWCRAHKVVTVRMALLPSVDTGWPDLQILIPDGKPFWIELKRAGKKPTPKQEVKLRVLHENGYDAAWFDNADDAIAAIASRLERLE